MPPCLRSVEVWVDGHGGGRADGCDAPMRTEVTMLARFAETEVECEDELATNMQ